MRQEQSMQSLPEAGTVTEVELNVPRADHPVLGWLGLVLVVVLFAGFIASYFEPAITEPDDNGYFAQATRWVTGGTTWFKSSSDAEYIGMHWLWDKQSNTYVSRYPPGLPAFIAVLYKLGGYQVAMLANPILAVLSLIGFYFTARRLIAVPWGAHRRRAPGDQPHLHRPHARGRFPHGRHVLPHLGDGLPPALAEVRLDVADLPRRPRARLRANDPLSRFPRRPRRRRVHRHHAMASQTTLPRPRTRGCDRRSLIARGWG
jgi:hypothetical protein